MKPVRRFKRKVRALQAQKLGLLRELLAAQGCCRRLAPVPVPAREATKK